MAEETTNPVQTAPAEEAPPAAPAAREAVLTAAPTAPPARPDTAPRKGSPLLAFLTVLLILVGVADLALWGLAGFYFLGGP